MRLYRTAGRPRNRRLSTSDMELAWVMYSEGRLTIAEIAAELMVAPGTLSIYFREWRVALGGMEFLRSLDAPEPRAGRQGRPPEMDYRAVDARRERVAELTSQGFNSNQIANELQISRNTVTADQRRLGLR